MVWWFRQVLWCRKVGGGVFDTAVSHSATGAVADGLCVQFSKERLFIGSDMLVNTDARAHERVPAEGPSLLSTPAARKLQNTQFP